MKVHQLIYELMKLPPNSEIVVWNSDGDSWTTGELHLVEYDGRHLLEWDGWPTELGIDAAEKNARS